MEPTHNVDNMANARKPPRKTSGTDKRDEKMSIPPQEASNIGDTDTTQVTNPPTPGETAHDGTIYVEVDGTEEANETENMMLLG